MSLRLTTVCTFAVVATALAGCSNPSSNSSLQGSINAGAIVSMKTLTPAAKAERLADASEQLMSVQGFDYANDVVDLALEQDPTNVKAQFIKVLLGPIMAQKGIVARVAPLASLDPQAADGYSKVLAKIDEAPNSTLKTFLNFGAGNIKTEADIQAYLDGVSSAFGAIREFAKTHKSATIVMNGTDMMFTVLTQRNAELCTVTSEGSESYSYSCPSRVAMLQTTIDRGDLEVIEQYAAGMELYLSMYNSYDLTGAISVAQAQAAKTGQVADPQQILNQLLANSAFGTLRANAGFSKVKDLGADAITAVRWIMANQAKLCPMGKSNAHNRVGALVNQGLCVEAGQQANVNQATRKIEAALNGAVLPATMQTSAGVVSTVIKPAALLDTPVANIRSLGPVSFNACGNISSIGDASLGGLYPQKDFNSFLQFNSQCH